jgi:hypothetical protein
MHQRWRTLAGTTKHTPSAFWVAMTSYSDSSLFGVGPSRRGHRRGFWLRPWPQYRFRASRARWETDECFGSQSFPVSFSISCAWLRSSRAQRRSRGRTPPLKALPRLRVLPSADVGPVDLRHGCRWRMSARSLAQRSGRRGPRLRPRRQTRHPRHHPPQ